MKRKAIDVAVGVVIAVAPLVAGAVWLLVARANGAFVGLFGGFSYPL